MNGLLRLCIAVVLALALPLAAPAQPRGGPRGGGGGPRGGAGPGARPTVPFNRAPIARPASPARPPGPPQGGFNFNRDIGARPAPIQRPVPVRPPPVVQRPPAPIQRPGPPRPVAIPPGRPPIAFHGPPIANPHHWNGAWGWNRGVVWQPAPIYWGGGFWGPWAIATLGAAALYGAIVNNNVTYPSYQVQPDSPGAILLQNYGLQQTPCGPPGLVVIWGPNNSVICAYPNNVVGPGNYELDPSTLTITSA